MQRTLSADARAAILSVHSHGDRSFLDDRDLAVLSGDLRREGIDNDLVVAVLDPRVEDDPDAHDVLRRLVDVLAGYPIVVYERVWSRGLIVAIRERLPRQVFVHCRGEHALEDPPADYVCQGELRETLPELVHHLRGARGAPPPGTRARGPDGWQEVGAVVPRRKAGRRFEPNLAPIVINAEALPELRTFAVLGNAGCPYQADARDNPVYAGVRIPERWGRGCAFCTTGNQYLASPNPETARRVLEQIVTLRRRAPEIAHLVLKDQNPFGYLTEVVTECAGQELGAFTLLLETRADWFLKNERRFERALAAARDAEIRIAPYLVGIENFSQSELDRMNKGISAETNLRFLEALWSWQERFRPALDLGHAAFGFVLFTPWTTLGDLRTNLEAIRRTRLYELRGHLLLSRARLYPDTALYYLAERDGLLAERYRSREDDASARYGYYPARPWRFQHADVARFAELATTLVDQTGGHDELAVFECLLDAFETDPRDVTAEEVLGALRAAREVVAGVEPAALRRRLVTLLSPLDAENGFERGWRLGSVALERGTLRAVFSHASEEPLVLDIRPRGDGPRFACSRHYDLSYANDSLSDSQRSALATLCRAVRANDA